MIRAIIAVFAVLLVSFGAAAEVVRGKASIADANTLVINGQRLRLAGIDAPESNQRCKLPSGIEWFCGRAAAQVLFTIAHERQAVCTTLASRRADDGGFLAYCTIATVDVGSEMIRRGMAWAGTDASAEYRSFEAAAAKAKRGIFQTPTERADAYRARRWREAKAERGGACAIKGNVDGIGRRIYHLPWSQWYALTKISENRGERWFCDERAAVAAGWQRAKWNFVPRLAASDMPKGGVLENQR